MKLTLAYPDVAAQLPDAPLGVAREPADPGQDGQIKWSRILNRGGEDLGEGRSAGCGVWLLNHLFEPHVLHGALEIGKWNFLVEQFRRRNAEQAGRAAGMQPSPCDVGANRQSSHERNVP